MDYLFIPDLNSLRVECCGMAIVPPGWKHHRRNMDTTVIILGEQGSVDLEENSKPLRIEEGSFCILAAGQTHQGTKPCADKARYFWLHFHTPELPYRIDESEAVQILSCSEIARNRLGNSLLLPTSMKLKNPGKLREQFQELLAEDQRGSFTPHTFQLRSKLLLIAFNETVLDSFQDPRRDSLSGLAGTMIQYIHENLSDHSFSVKRLAYDLGYNSDYLNRHFRKIMNQPLNEYIIDKRIELSVRYVTDTNLPFAEIASRSGFSSYRSYIRQFIDRKDLRPSEYRRRHRSMHITN
ncbi:MAG TPA: AraC family transcriptional regulator [Treponemataceae bacterium]|jgi:AraC-like DNA-binding protein|nr:AraC family transcriptional regulator [Treponemataceae bacterium]HPX25641.1 AraC family transcriptional regulator [Treponemataceae bacterium]